MYKSLLSIFLLVLTACGFHLRGVGDNKIEVSELYLRSFDEDNLSTTALKNALKSSSVKILETEQEGVLVVMISDFYSTSRQTATGSAVEDSREIEIIDGYELRVIRNEKVLASTKIESRSNLQYTASQYSGNEKEAAEIRNQLAEENANSALRFINATIKNKK